MVHFLKGHGILGYFMFVFGLFLGLARLRHKTLDSLVWYFFVEAFLCL